MTVTTIPTKYALNEAMRSLALSTIIALCEQYKISSAELEMVAHQLAKIHKLSKKTNPAR